MILTVDNPDIHVHALDVLDEKGQLFSRGYPYRRSWHQGSTERYTDHQQLRLPYYFTKPLPEVFGVRMTLFTEPADAELPFRLSRPRVFTNQSASNNDSGNRFSGATRHVAGTLVLLLALFRCASAPGRAQDAAPPPAEAGARALTVHPFLKKVEAHLRDKAGSPDRRARDYRHAWSAFLKQLPYAQRLVTENNLTRVDYVQMVDGGLDVTAAHVALVSAGTLYVYSLDLFRFWKSRANDPPIPNVDYYWKRPLTPEERETLALLRSRFVPIAPDAMTIWNDAAQWFIAVPLRDGQRGYAHFEDPENARLQNETLTNFAQSLHAAARVLNDRERKEPPEGWTKVNLPPPFAPPPR